MRSEWHRCRQTAPTECILYAAAKWGEPATDLERVAMCESRDQWSADNGYDLGLFQFLPSTWASTPYAAKSIYSARFSSLAAAWMWAQGHGPAADVRAPNRWQGDQWQCV